MSEAGLIGHLVFKGGTMLRKMIFGQAGRLSTDLDFVVLRRTESLPTTWRSRSLPFSATIIEV
ncbi:hypothetical protein GWE18_22810 [Bradyrhizobium sp. CSA112]|uniref:nucleotidyl transferase AbiEii/AbiGii toxin family protein n=1 Tax=Bradyrhizobium sp. CSA112 TaxID=2699170 RepID=UPI0023B15299|nr:nucleotidyl transferase AbiEii/AbiGii toxin family protein [Bradyrhizobium sp. CSA112]MDE5455618.1 hypothetical protein [Bradyrhizobium sp. CSA112]